MTAPDTGHRKRFGPNPRRGDSRRASRRKDPVHRPPVHRCDGDRQERHHPARRSSRHVIEGGQWIDGSSIAGFTRIAESDMYLMPDLSTYAVHPLGARRAPDRPRDLLGPQPERRSLPRRSPRRALSPARAAGQAGYTLQDRTGAGVLPLQKDGDKILRCRTTAAATSTTRPTSPPRSARRWCVALEQNGHRRRGKPPRGRDRSARDRLRVRRCARYRRPGRHLQVRAEGDRADSTASTRPSCRNRSKGSTAPGMHVHQSLGFVDGQGQRLRRRVDPYGLSEIAKHFIAGQLDHARAMCGVLAPLVNSYRRLVPGFEAPVYVSWARTNRSALIRVPAHPWRSTAATRIELRVPGSVLQSLSRLRGRCWRPEWTASRRTCRCRSRWRRTSTTSPMTI